MTDWFDARLLDPAVPVRGSADPLSKVIFEVTGSPMVKLGPSANGLRQIRLSDGRTGYVDEAVRIMGPQTLIIDQYGTTLQAEPSETSAVLGMLRKNTRVVQTEPVIERSGITWLHVMEGERAGYIRGDTPIRDEDLTTPAQSPVSAAATQTMLWGFVIFSAGAILTLGSYMLAEHTAGVYVVAWGAMLGGVVQILKGLGQVTTRV